MCHGSGCVLQHQGNGQTSVACPQCRGRGTNEYQAAVAKARRIDRQCNLLLMWIYLVLCTPLGLIALASLVVFDMLIGVLLLIGSTIIICHLLASRQRRLGTSGDVYKAVTYGAMGYSVLRLLKRHSER